jgi:hypothetical protein
MRFIFKLTCFGLLGLLFAGQCSVPLGSNVDLDTTPSQLSEEARALIELCELGAKIIRELDVEPEKTFPERTITAANNLQAILNGASAEARASFPVQGFLENLAVLIFNFYVENNPFGTDDSNNALVALHYTALYYSAAVPKRDKAFRPFLNSVSSRPFTPQEFAGIKKRLSPIDYFRHWAKVLPSHSLPGGGCSIS